jgi:transmembrane sensor
MTPAYTTYTITDFLDDAAFIAWGKGDAAAAAFWEGWLATGPPNAEAVRQARLQLGVLLAAAPVPVGAHTLRFIWLDVQQTLAEGQARARRRTWQWASAAATVAGLAVGGWLLSRPAPVALAFTTPYGQTRQLTLPDGTLVTLNAHSSLRRGAWQAGKPREVWLQGEAFFAVKHLDTDHHIEPAERFVVHTGPLAVEVLGTTFNVKQRRASTQVVLQSGRVRVSLAGHPTATVELAPHEEARFDSLSKRLLKLPTGSTAAALAWTDKRMLLHHTTVRDILQTVQDTYGYRAVLADPRLAEREVEGEIPLNDARSVLFVLSTVLHTPVTRRDSTIYVGRFAR